MLLRDNQEKEVALKRMYRKQQVYIHDCIFTKARSLYIYTFIRYFDTVCDLPAYACMLTEF